jgi:4-phospho-D-threonate 3-dehydrogenase / 4-phospho-D-erythronate 3-dehydrogenase
MNLIGITMGDPAGIGPEIIIKALETKPEYRKKAIVFGSSKVIEYYKNLLKVNRNIKVLDSIDEFDSQCINVINVLDLDMSDFEIGKLSTLCGDAAFKYVKCAIGYALDKKIEGVVTAPLNKEAMRLAGHDYDGHTEIFAKLTNTKKYSMLLTSKTLKVVHVSTHVSLREACDRVKKERVLEVITLAYNTLKKMGYESPRIAVAGLNPHAGESGIFGREEIEEISPAIVEALKQGMNVEGPIAPDTVFLKAHNGKYDVVVAMYHDQGHIPAKLLAFDTGVNVSIGLPVVRTSVDHGTAFDIAGKGIASEESIIQALNIADMFKA